MIVQFLSEVLDACQNPGLWIVAAVCDVGASNFKALKLWGTTERKTSFKVL
jgi:hypothetical protein